MKIFTAPQHTRFVLPPFHPTKFFASLAGRYFSFGKLHLEFFISRLNEILRHDLTLSVGEPDNAAAQTGAGTAFGVNGDHEQGLCLFTRFCSAKFLTCIAVRLLKFSVLHGKGESKYRPVATNFQCLKNCGPHGLALVGVRLLHLLRKPCCHSKAPLGLSLLRNRGLVGECLPQTLLQHCAGFSAKAACRIT